MSSDRRHLDRVAARAVMLALIGILTACGGETVYTHVQTQDGLGMKAPITFTVRVRVDTARKVVTWMQDAEDALGVTDRQIRTYGDFSSSSCDVFDDRNWSCEIRGADGKMLEQPQMKDGILSRYYWTENQEYRKRRRILNRVF